MDKITIRREFAATPDALFEMFTVPARMVTWWGDGVTFDLDLREGGAWTITRRDGEKKYVATGQYEVVDPPTRLVYTYAMPQFSPRTDTISISIRPLEQGSELVFEHSGEDVRDELAALTDGETSETETAWRQMLDLIATAFAGDAG